VAVIISGRRSFVHNDEYESGIIDGVVSLHCMGANDQITCPDKSRELSLLFQAVDKEHTFVHEHAGGHVIPDTRYGLGDQVSAAFRAAGLQTTGGEAGSGFELMGETCIASS
jgi:hypothetical protein